MRQLGKAAKKLRLAGGIGVDVCARKNRRFHIDAPDAGGLHPCRGIQPFNEGNGDCDTLDGLATLSWSPMAIEPCPSVDADLGRFGSDRPGHRPSPVTNRLSAATVHIVRP